MNSLHDTPDGASSGFIKICFQLVHEILKQCQTTGSLHACNLSFILHTLNISKYIFVWSGMPLIPKVKPETSDLKNNGSLLLIWFSNKDILLFRTVLCYTGVLNWPFADFKTMFQFVCVAGSGLNFSNIHFNHYSYRFCAIVQGSSFALLSWFCRDFCSFWWHFIFPLAPVHFWSWCVYIIVMYSWLWRECNSRVWWFSNHQPSHPAMESKSAEVMGDTSRM